MRALGARADITMGPAGRVVGFRGDGTDEALLEVVRSEFLDEKVREAHGRVLATWRTQWSTAL